jgi:hypothetical protein
MVTSSNAGWDELSQRKPSLIEQFFRVVFFPSVMAAGMLLYAAWFHGSDYGAQVPFYHWEFIAFVFLTTSWACVHIMAAFIRVSVHSIDKPDYADCYRLAAIAPLPIWMSALSLFVPIPLFNVRSTILGLLASGGFIFHGLVALFEHDSSVRTQSQAYTVFSVGVLVWALIVAILVIPLM